jgi:hypothetical protein
MGKVSRRRRRRSFRFLLRSRRAFLLSSVSSAGALADNEFSGEIARDYFEKRHEPGLRVGRHGEAALEGSGAVSSSNLGAEDEGVTAVEGDSWLDEN